MRFRFDSVCVQSTVLSHFTLVSTLNVYAEQLDLLKHVALLPEEDMQVTAKG